MDKIGYLLTTFNDFEMGNRMFPTLLSTCLDNNSEIVVVDAGSDINHLKEFCTPKGLDYVVGGEHLSVCLNLGIDTLLARGCEWVVWIHVDQLFFIKDMWRKLANVYNTIDPLCGRLSPTTSNIDNGISELQQNKLLRHGNNCPWIMRRDVLIDFKQKDGFVFDPKYLNIFGVEDHDLWFRMIQNGQFSLICSLLDCFHIGAGTRFSLGRDTTSGQFYNREVFHKKWNTDIFPVINFSLDEINKELILKYGDLKDDLLNWHNKHSISWNGINEKDQSLVYENKGKI